MNVLAPRLLGRTRLTVSAIGFGAGPVPALMTGEDPSLQREVLARAVAVGINWIDTAAGYGNGQSERSLGRALHELDAQEQVHVATKVRLAEGDREDIFGAIHRSVEASLERLQLPAVTLLQLHNGITMERGQIPASLTPEDILERGGVLEALQRLREEGKMRFLGLTGTGSPEALREVIDSGEFDTIQLPHHLISPANASVLARCAAHQMGVFAIRVFAGGAILGHPPSAHTLQTPFFPLAVYEEERRQAERLEQVLGTSHSRKELALRFALSTAVPQMALVGFSAAEQVDEVAELAGRGPLPAEMLAQLAELIAALDASSQGTRAEAP